MIRSGVDWPLVEKHFFVSRKDREDAVFRAVVGHLLDENKLNEFVDSYMPLIRARERDAAGAYLCKWFSAVCAVTQYFLSVYDASPKTELNEWEMQVYMKDGYPWMSFKMKDENPVPLDNGRERSEQVRLRLSRFYGDQARPFFEKVARVTGADPGLLWGQVVTRMLYAKDQITEHLVQDALIEKVEDDFRILQELPGSVFGRKRNPFGIRPRMVESPTEPGKMIRIKASCCLFYKTGEEARYCYTCPRISETEREEKRKALLQKSGQ